MNYKVQIAGKNYCNALNCAMQEKIQEKFSSQIWKLSNLRNKQSTFGGENGFCNTVPGAKVGLGRVSISSSSALKGRHNEREERKNLREIRKGEKKFLFRCYYYYRWNHTRVLLTSKTLWKKKQKYINKMLLKVVLNVRLVILE